MYLFRNLTFQRTISLTFLFAVLLSQTQMLYACEKMDGKPRMVCCCDEQMSDKCAMATPCSMHEQTDQSKCCEISYDSLTDVSMTQGTSTADLLTLLLDGAQPPPLFSEQTLPIGLLKTNHRLLFPPDRPLSLSNGNHTYLLTRRIRL